MGSPTPLKVSDSGLAPEHYTIGWIGLLFKEQTAAIMMLDKKNPDIEMQSNHPNAYSLGSIGPHNVVIACLPPGWGGHNTIATIAVWMTSTFPSIRRCLLVGIGGGIPARVRLGDVVVGVPDGEFPGVVAWREDGEIAGINHPPSILLSTLTKLKSIHEIEGSNVPKYLDEFKKHHRLASIYLVSEELKDPLFEKNEDKTTAEGDTTTSTSTTREAEIYYGLIASTSLPIKDITSRENLDSRLGSRRLLCIDTVASELLTDFHALSFVASASMQAKVTMPIKAGEGLQPPPQLHLRKRSFACCRNLK
ncbi:nucleoside phosphorylase domain-containing protein [Nemania diffusa]|nr:nucleoside phosphorylase domain-containing protein [Nemania diffusa]